MVDVTDMIYNKIIIYIYECTIKCTPSRLEHCKHASNLTYFVKYAY